MLALIPFIPTGFSPAGDNGFTVLSGRAAAGRVARGHARRSPKRFARGVMQLPDVDERLHIDRRSSGRRRTGRAGDSAGNVRRATLTIQLDDRATSAT